MTTTRIMRELVVKPSKPWTGSLPLLVYESDRVLDLNGEFHDMEWLAWKSPPSVVVANSSMELVLSLLRERPQAYISGTDLREDGMPGISGVVLNRFRAGDREQGLSIIVCPDSLESSRIALRPRRSLDELRDWGINYLAFCADLGVRPSSSASSLASSVFGSMTLGRRNEGRVPRLTNERLRPYLPGPCMDYPDDGKTTHDHVWILDQRSSHHMVASTTPLPAPSSQFVSLFFHGTSGKMCPTDTNLYRELITRPGFFMCRVSYLRPPMPGMPSGASFERVGLWSPVIERILSGRIACQIHGIEWCVTSPDTWSRASDYASQALTVRAAHNHPWVKRVLVTAYGMMGSVVRPYVRIATRGAGEDSVIHLRGETIDVKRIVKRGVSYKWSNMAALGIIQCESVMRTQDMISDIRAAGGVIRRVYSDGFHFTGSPIMVDDTSWSYELLTRVRYMSGGAYISKERVVRPGVAGSDLARRKEALRLIRRLEDAPQSVPQSDTLIA